MQREGLNEIGVSHALDEMNPWWRGAPLNEKPPSTRRHIWQRIERRLDSPSDNTAVNILGPRFVGKTTVLMQLAELLLSRGVPPKDILFASFDDHRLQTAGFNEVVDYWLGRHAGASGLKYLLLDEVQMVEHWGTRVKNMVDRSKDRRIFFTGSSLSLSTKFQESGAGRWVREHMGTMSFGEYLEITDAAPHLVPEGDLFETMDLRVEATLFSLALELKPRFDKYLLQGGFPWTATQPDQLVARGKFIQQFGMILSRDLPEQYGIDDPKHLSLLHSYFTQTDGGILNYNKISSGLGISAKAVKKLVGYLEAGNLVRLLPGMSQGKQTLLGRAKVYITDQSVVAALRHHGLEDIETEAGGRLVESAVFNHLLQNSLNAYSQLSYWRDSHGNEVDFVTLLPRREIVPIEVKHRFRTRENPSLKGLVNMHRDKKFKRCYMITKLAQDVGLDKLRRGDPTSPMILRLPASVFCLLLSKPDAGLEDGRWL